MNIRAQWNTTYVMAVAATQSGRVIDPRPRKTLAIVFLTLLVILVAREPGVAHVTRALIWAVILLFMVMPWQFFARDFPIPGVLYGYQELLHLVGPQVVSANRSPDLNWLAVLWPLCDLPAGQPVLFTDDVGAIPCRLDAGHRPSAAIHHAGTADDFGDGVPTKTVTTGNPEKKPG